MKPCKTEGYAHKQIYSIGIGGSFSSIKQPDGQVLFTSDLDRADHFLDFIIYDECIFGEAPQ